MMRPIKELKGFSKIMLKAGEEKNVTFNLGFEELAFYNAKAEFKVEKGEFTVYAGGDCYTKNKLKIKVV